MSVWGELNGSLDRAKDFWNGVIGDHSAAKDDTLNYLDSHPMQAEKLKGLRDAQHHYPTDPSLQSFGETSPKFYDDATKPWVEADPVMKDFITSDGYSLKVGPTQTTIDPSLKGKAAAASPNDPKDDRTLDNQKGGLCWTDKKTITVSEYELQVRQGKDQTKQDEAKPEEVAAGDWASRPDVSSVVRHEMGHAVNRAAQDKYGKMISETKSFKQAYDEDVARMGGAEAASKKGWEYYADPSKDPKKARNETFANLWGQNAGGGINGEKMKKDWPSTYAYAKGPDAVKKYMESLDTDHPQFKEPAPDVQAKAVNEAPKTTTPAQTKAPPAQQPGNWRASNYDDWIKATDPKPKEKPAQQPGRWQASNYGDWIKATDPKGTDKPAQTPPQHPHHSYGALQQETHRAPSSVSPAPPAAHQEADGFLGRALDTHGLGKYKNQALESNDKRRQQLGTGIALYDKGHASTFVGEQRAHLAKEIYKTMQSEGAAGQAGVYKDALKTLGYRADDGELTNLNKDQRVNVEAAMKNPAIRAELSAQNTGYAIHTNKDLIANKGGAVTGQDLYQWESKPSAVNGGVSARETAPDVTHKQTQSLGLRV